MVTELASSQIATTIASSELRKLGGSGEISQKNVETLFQLPSADADVAATNVTATQAAEPNTVENTVPLADLTDAAGDQRLFTSDAVQVDLSQEAQAQTTPSSTETNAPQDPVAAFNADAASVALGNAVDLEA